ncbi:holo-ACP synthase [Haloimpatiens sp. FM7315]|uniref:holo-ACP synthase n=1 Tax=Haloimpatiens sp. FM7315 TaxID=3298609 RepID=UPI0035A2E3E5
MIYGVGTDIVEICRIEDILNKNRRFLNKIFTEEEIVSLEERNLRTEYIAGRFAAKEAVSKALGTGFRGFNFKSIVVKSDELGKPKVELQGVAKDIAEEKGEYIIHLSISHGRENAIAYAIWEVMENENRNI